MGDLYVQYMTVVPAAVRVLLGIAVTVGITLWICNHMYERALILNRQHAKHGPSDAPGEAGEDTTGLVDAPELANRVLAITATAFVFLLAFALANFWSTSKDAHSAAQGSFSSGVQVRTIAQAFEPRHAQAVDDAVAEYMRTVMTDVWPMLEQGHTPIAYRIQNLAGEEFSQQLAAVGRSGADQSPSWSTLTSSAQDMLTDGTQLVSDIPGRMVPSVLLVIAALAVFNLALTAAFHPTAKGSYLALMGCFAAVTALMVCVVVEVSSPFIGSGAIRVETMQEVVR